jgi:ubiquinone/menaquinone biosynthesis C-methylase UbiE
MRRINAWWQIFKAVGGGMKTGRQIDQLFRYFVLESLHDIDFFAYLSRPRSYGEILAEFGFIDSDYTRELFGTLVNDPHPLLLENNGVYSANPEQRIPSIEEVLTGTDFRLHPIKQMAEDLTVNILDRLRDENVSIEEVFERNENKVTNMLHEVMGTPVYSKIRSGVFAFLPRKERRWIRGKRLLDVGCGSGRETVEIWNRYGGDIRLTAIDPVPSMLELARRNFPVFLKKLNPNHPPITDINMPEFKLGDAVRLPFDDDSFDTIFWAAMLHWVSSPKKAITEAVRVVRPGGLIIGSVAIKPYVNPYLNLVIRSSRNSYGAFWKEEYVHWFKELGLKVEVATPVGLFRARNEPIA